MIPLTIPWLCTGRTKNPCLDLSSPLPSFIADVTIMAWRSCRFSWSRPCPLSRISSSTTWPHASTASIVTRMMQDLVAAALSTPKGGGDVPPSPLPPLGGYLQQATKPYQDPKCSGSSPAPSPLTGRRTAWLGSLQVFYFGGKLATLANIGMLDFGINFIDGSR